MSDENENESVVRAAYEAYGRGEVNRLLELVHPDLEWTYLDPSMENPQPQTCRGREELAEALGQQAERGLVSEVQEIASSGDKVMVAVRTPGADQRRAWQAEDRSYLVLTLDQGRIVAMRDFRDRSEACSFAGLGQGMR
jgi:ketosteroid isomerase-like protein